MPAQYERIRDSLVARGENYDKAQAIAAATYNKQHPGHPMGKDEHTSSAHKDALLKMLRDR